MKGKKLCPQCQKSLGARTLVCDCGFIFKVRNSKRKSVRKLINPEDLKKGDIVYVKRGPYFVPKSVEGEEQPDRVYMGERGKFRFVRRLSDEVLLMQEVSRSQADLYVSVYIGPKRKSQYLDNYILRPHKIYKIIKIK